MTVQTEIAEKFSKEWIEAWNSHDIDKILSHYTEDFEMSSPLIESRMGITSGTLKGKEAVREYWCLGLQKQPDLHFETINVCLGANSITINYKGPNGLSAETFFLNHEGKAYRAYAHYMHYSQ